MIDVTVKTLDSQNHVFNVEEDDTVKQFKELISSTIGIPTDQQRLIFRGRVLQDDKKLSEYSVASSVVHVVQRPSNQNSTTNDEPRPSSQTGMRMNDGGGILFSADDGTGGARNAIIMGAIGLPTIDIEGHSGDDDGGNAPPRRSGAAVRLMVGNQMLNRAFNLIQRLEDDDAVAAATSSASSSTDQNSPDDESVSNSDMPMEIDDEPQSIERMISQVVNVSSAAGLVAAIRQVQPPGPGAAANNAVTQPTNNNSSAPAGGDSGTGVVTSTAAGRTGNGNTASPARRPDSPRLRELATALQDLLALQDRLNPFLRFLQDSLRQNRLYTEPGESQSTQYVFDTISSVMHALSHSLHAFSDIMCDFSIVPEDRRLTASSSILVEQSTVVRATIPVGIMPAMLAAGGGGNPGAPGIPGHPGAVGIPGNPGHGHPGTTPPTTNPSTTTTTTQAPPQAQANPNPSLQQFANNPMAGINITGGMLPPGLQNLGALLGMGGAGMVNIFGGPGGPISMPIGQGGIGQIPGFNIRPNNNNNAGNQQQPGNAASTGSDQNTPPTPTPTPTANSGNSTPRQQGQGATGTESNNNNNGGGGMFGNFQQLRNELSRSQYDVLLPCSTHHSSGRSRANRTRPAEFQRFVNVGSSESSVTQSSTEGEAVNIIMDLIRHSQIIDMLQPVLKDVVLNYLMRGRDPKNDAHVRTCAKGLVKKLLPFFEKFSNKVGSKDENVDISATYSNILTDFISSLMQRILGPTPGGDALFKIELLNSITSLQKQLIEAFKVCYPTCTNVGLLFVNYVVENCVGGMSVLFKEQVRLQLVEHLKEIEKKPDTVGNTTETASKPSFVVYKTSGPSAPSPSSSNVSDLSSSASAPLKTPPPSAVLDIPPVAPPKKPSLSTTSNTDDVDIDEVLQMPTSMAPSSSQQQQNHNAPRRGAAAQGHPNQTDSIASHMRNLPSEWLDTVQQDVRRQVEMPPQPAFSPGYNTLFPRKH
ncbi:unnamed protein product [Orchesella dallaii]|uniref:Large proline-rich protein BAG6 n=1 Tax=Orchesella dallaii TaxID=48710 RepID=A0ABP1RSY0_9HEXA